MMKGCLHLQAHAASEVSIPHTGASLCMENAPLSVWTPALISACVTSTHKKNMYIMKTKMLCVAKGNGRGDGTSRVSGDALA